MENREIDITPNYAHMFKVMLRDAQLQSQPNNLRRDLENARGPELLRVVQRFFAPLTIAAQCATTVVEIEQLRKAMGDMLGALDKEALRLEQVAYDAQYDEHASAPGADRGLL